MNKYIKDISKVNIIKVATLTDVKNLNKKLNSGKITFKDIDIIVICSNLLINDKYTDLVKTNKDNNMEKSKFLDIFETKFNRIIVDEIHEITIPYQPYGENHNYLFCRKNHKNLKKAGRELLEILNTKLDSNFRWCLTATPLIMGLFNLMGILNFLLSLEDKIKHQISINDYGIVKGFSDEFQMQGIVKKHFKGIKKSDIRNVIDIPIFTEKIIKIPL